MQPQTTSWGMDPILQCQHFHRERATLSFTLCHARLGAVAAAGTKIPRNLWAQGCRVCVGQSTVCLCRGNPSCSSPSPGTAALPSPFSFIHLPPSAPSLHRQEYLWAFLRKLLESTPHPPPASLPRKTTPEEGHVLHLLVLALVCPLPDTGWVPKKPLALPGVAPGHPAHLPAQQPGGSGAADGSEGSQGEAVLGGAGGWDSGQPGITAPLTDAGMGSKANVPSKNVPSQAACALHCPLVCLGLRVPAIDVKTEEKGK